MAKAAKAAKAAAAVDVVDEAEAPDNEYPMMIYSTGKDRTVLQKIVKNADERAKAGKAWRESPDEG